VCAWKITKFIAYLPWMRTVSNIVHWYLCICCVMQMNEEVHPAKRGRGGGSGRRGWGLGIGSRVWRHPVTIHAG